jgi:hypothetical protein
MNHSPLTYLSGTWSGNYRLWLDPNAPAPEAPTHLVATVNASGRYVTLAYNWSHDGDAHDGVLVFNVGNRAAVASWVDTFHMSDGFMISRGSVAGARVDLRGSYAAPPGPDWGWRTVLEADANDSLRILMYNIAPDGKEYPAVEADYRRVSSQK